MKLVRWVPAPEPCDWHRNVGSSVQLPTCPLEMRQGAGCGRRSYGWCFPDLSTPSALPGPGCHVSDVPTPDLCSFPFTCPRHSAAGDPSRCALGLSDPRLGPCPPLCSPFPLSPNLHAALPEMKRVKDGSSTTVRTAGAPYFCLPFRLKASRGQARVGLTPRYSPSAKLRAQLMETGAQCRPNRATSAAAPSPPHASPRATCKACDRGACFSCKCRKTD